jgi:hypothetical protein
MVRGFLQSKATIPLTSYLVTPQTDPACARVLLRDVTRNLQLSGFQIAKLMETGGGENLRLYPLQIDRAQIAWRVLQNRWVIVEVSGKEESLEAAKEGGLRARFVLIQKDARCCYV